MASARLLFTAAALALSLACAGPITAASAETHTFTTSAAPTVVVSGYNGSIQVKTSPLAQVTANVFKKGNGWSHSEADAALDNVHVTFNQTGDTVQITAEGPGGPGNSGADITVTLPPAAKLELTTSDGDIEAQAISGEVTARTSNGTINLDGGQGTLDVHTSNGLIQLHPSAPALVSAHTSNADISFTGTLLAGLNDFETSNAGITIKLPSGSQFQLDAQTSNAGVFSSFPFATFDSHGESQLSGRVGSDTSIQVRATTSNGTVRVDPF